MGVLTSTVAPQKAFLLLELQVLLPQVCVGYPAMLKNWQLAHGYWTLAGTLNSSAGSGSTHYILAGFPKVLPH